MREEVLEIEYEVDYYQFRQVWLSYFKKSLPNMIAFWGVAILLSLGFLYFLDEKLIGTAMTLIFVLVPLYMIYASYQSFTKNARQTYRQMSDEERIVHITFVNGADGFDSRNGKNI